MRELPVLNESRCTHCGDCVILCPVDCLSLHSGQPWLIRPRDCIACHVCELVCPTNAIEVKSWTN